MGLHPAGCLAAPSAVVVVVVVVVGEKRRHPLHRALQDAAIFTHLGQKLGITCHDNCVGHELLAWRVLSCSGADAEKADHHHHHHHQRQKAPRLARKRRAVTFFSVHLVAGRFPSWRDRGVKYSHLPCIRDVQATSLEDRAGWDESSLDRKRSLLDRRQVRIWLELGGLA